MVEEEKIPPEVKKDLLKEGWTPPAASEVPKQVIPTETPAEAPKKTSEVPAEVPAEFICEDCGKAFDTKRKLTGHMRIHSTKKEKGRREKGRSKEKIIQL